MTIPRADAAARVGRRGSHGAGEERAHHRATDRRARLLPMVKANGYGLGAVPCQPGPRGGRSVGLRRGDRRRRHRPPRGGHHATHRRVLSRCCRPDWRSVPRTTCVPSLGDVASLAAWLPNGKPFHLEIDTGMARAGLRWNDGTALAEARTPARGRRAAGRGCSPISTRRTPIRPRPRSSGSRFRAGAERAAAAPAAGACREQRGRLRAPLRRRPGAARHLPLRWHRGGHGTGTGGAPAARAWSRRVSCTPVIP